MSNVADFNIARADAEYAKGVESTVQSLEEFKDSPDLLLAAHILAGVKDAPVGTKRYMIFDFEYSKDKLNLELYSTIQGIFVDNLDNWVDPSFISIKTEALDNSTVVDLLAYVSRPALSDWLNAYLSTPSWFSEEITYGQIPCGNFFYVGRTLQWFIDIGKIKIVEQTATTITFMALMDKNIKATVVINLSVLMADLQAIGFTAEDFKSNDENNTAS